MYLGGARVHAGACTLSHDWLRPCVVEFYAGATGVLHALMLLEAVDSDSELGGSCEENETSPHREGEGVMESSRCLFDCRVRPRHVEAASCKGLLPADAMWCHMTARARHVSILSAAGTARMLCHRSDWLSSVLQVGARSLDACQCECRRCGCQRCGC